jgi:transposase
MACWSWRIAARLRINRRTVAGLAAAAEPPSRWRAPAVSMLDPLEGVLRRLLEQWPEIKATRVAVLGRADGAFQFRPIGGVVSEGPVRALEWLGGVPRECVYDNLRSVVARSEGDVIQ